MLFGRFGFKIDGQSSVNTNGWPTTNIINTTVTTTTSRSNVIRRRRWATDCWCSNRRHRRWSAKTLTNSSTVITIINIKVVEGPDKKHSLTSIIRNLYCPSRRHPASRRPHFQTVSSSSLDFLKQFFNWTFFLFPLFNYKLVNRHGWGAWAERIVHDATKLR